MRKGKFMTMLLAMSLFVTTVFPVGSLSAAQAAMEAGEQKSAGQDEAKEAEEEVDREPEAGEESSLPTLRIDDLTDLPAYIGEGLTTLGYNLTVTSDSDGLATQVGTRLWKATKVTETIYYGEPGDESMSYISDKLVLKKLIYTDPNPVVSVQSGDETYTGYSVSGKFMLDGIEAGDLLLPEVYLKDHDRSAPEVPMEDLTPAEGEVWNINTYNYNPGVTVVGAVGLMTMSGAVTEYKTLNLQGRSLMPELSGEAWKWVVEAKSGMTWYTGSSSEPTEHTFTLRSAAAQKASDISAQGATLKNVTVSAKDSYGLSNIKGVMTVPAAAGNVTLSIGTQDISLNIVRLAATSNPYVTNIRAVSYDPEEGKAALELSGINLSDLATDYSSGNGSEVIFKGYSLKKSGGLTTLYLEKKADIEDGALQHIELRLNGTILNALEFSNIDTGSNSIKEGQFFNTAQYSLVKYDSTGKYVPIESGDMEDVRTEYGEDPAITIKGKDGDFEYLPLDQAGNENMLSTTGSYITAVLDRKNWISAISASSYTVPCMTLNLKKNGLGVWSKEETEMGSASSRETEVEIPLSSGYGDYILECACTWNSETLFTKKITINRSDGTPAQPEEIGMDYTGYTKYDGYSKAHRDTLGEEQPDYKAVYYLDEIDRRDRFYGEKAVKPVNIAGDFVFLKGNGGYIFWSKAPRTSPQVLVFTGSDGESKTHEMTWSYANSRWELKTEALNSLGVFTSWEFYHTESLKYRYKDESGIHYSGFGNRYWHLGKATGLRFCAKGTEDGTFINVSGTTGLEDGTAVGCRIDGGSLIWYYDGNWSKSREFTSPPFTPKVEGAEFHSTRDNFDDSQKAYKIMITAAQKAAKETNRYSKAYYRSLPADELVVDHIELPVSNPDVKTPKTAEDGTWVTPEEYYTASRGARIVCGFWRDLVEQMKDDPGAQFSADLIYRNNKDEDVSVTAMAEPEDTYGQRFLYLTVPKDAMWLDTIRYEIKDGGGNLVYRWDFNMKAYFVAGLMNIEDVGCAEEKKADMSDDYWHQKVENDWYGFDGTTLSMYGITDNGDYVTVKTDLRSGKLNTLGTLMPGLYSYELTKGGRHVHYGKNIRIDADTNGISMLEGDESKGIVGLKVPMLTGELCYSFTQPMNVWIQVWNGFAVAPAGIVSCRAIYPDGTGRNISLQVSGRGYARLNEYLPVGTVISDQSFTYDRETYKWVDVSPKKDGELFIRDSRTYIYSFAQFDGEAYKRGSLSGNVVNENGRPVRNADVILTQEISTKADTTFKHMLTARTDENGEFCFEARKDQGLGVSQLWNFYGVYTDYDASLTIRAAGYEQKVVSLSKDKLFEEGNKTGAVTMSYHGSLTINPRLMIRPAKLVSAARKEKSRKTQAGYYLYEGYLTNMKTEYEAGKDAAFEGDSRMLHVKEIRAFADEWAVAAPHYKSLVRDEDFIETPEGAIQIVSDSVIKTAESIQVILDEESGAVFGSGDRQVALESSVASIELSDGKSANAYFYASDEGVTIRSYVVDEDNEEDEVGFLVLESGKRDDDFKKNPWSVDKVADFAWGTGTLSVSAKPSYGNFTKAGAQELLTFKAKRSDVPYITQMIRYNPDRLLQIAVGKPKSIKRTSLEEAPLSGSCITISQSAMTQNMADAAIGYFSFDYKVEPCAFDQDFVELKGTLTKRNPQRLKEAANAKVYFTLANQDGTFAEEPEINPAFYINGKTVEAGSAGVLSERFSSCSIYAKLPLNQDTNDIDYRFTVQYDGGRQHFNVHEEVELFSLSVPETIGIQDEVAAAYPELLDKPEEWKKRGVTWNVNAFLRAVKSEDDKENAITVFDNGTPIYTNSYIAGGNMNLKLQLTDCLTPGEHVIWAERDKKNSEGQYEKVTTARKTVKVVNRGNALYISELHWYHNNDRGMQDFYYPTLSSFSGKTMRIWPIKNSIMTFKVNGPVWSNIKAVNLMVSGTVEGEYPARCITYNEEEKWSYWVVYDDSVNKGFEKTIAAGDKYKDSEYMKSCILDYGRSFGAVSGFDIDVDLFEPAGVDDEDIRQQQLAARCFANGEPVPDYTDAIVTFAKASDENLETYLKGERELISDELTSMDTDVSCDGDVIRAVMTSGDEKNSGIDRVELTFDTRPSFSEFISDMDDLSIPEDLAEGEDGIPVDAIYLIKERDRALELSEGEQIYWSKVETKQGLTLTRHYEKVSAEDGKLKTTTRDTVFAPSAVVDAIRGIMDQSDGEEASPGQESVDGANLNDLVNPLSAAKYRDLAKGGKTMVLKELSDQTGNAVTYGTLIDNTVEFVRGKDNGLLSDSAGDLMTAVGVVTTAVEISRGPAGENPAQLLELLSKIEDRKARESLQADILDAIEVRNKCYDRTVWFKAITTGVAAKALKHPVLKLGCTLGTIAYGVVDGWGEDERRNTFNTLKESINQRIEFEKELGAMKARDAEAYDKAKQTLLENIKRRCGITSEEALKEELKYWSIEKDGLGGYKIKLKKDGSGNAGGSSGGTRKKVKNSVPKFNTYIDPSGYVFEGVEEDRVEGVTATIYTAADTGSADENGFTRYSDFLPWVDENQDENERQINPMTTSSGEGRYGWDVPAGVYRVGFNDPQGRYSDAVSVAMAVPPEHTQVNIGLMSNEAPAAKLYLHKNDGSVMVEFSKWMKPETLIRAQNISSITVSGNDMAESITLDLDDEMYYIDYSQKEFDANNFGISFYDVSGNRVDGTVTFPDRRENTGYSVSSDEAAYQTEFVDSQYFIKTASFRPVDKNARPASFAYGAGISSYSGIPLDEAASDDEFSVADESYEVSLDKESISLEIGDQAVLAASFSTVPECAADRELVWESSDETVVRAPGDGAIEAVGAGNAVVTVTAANGKAAKCSVTVNDFDTEGAQSDTNVPDQTDDPDAPGHTDQGSDKPGSGDGGQESGSGQGSGGGQGSGDSGQESGGGQGSDVSVVKPDPRVPLMEGADYAAGDDTFYALASEANIGKLLLDFSQVGDRNDLSITVIKGSKLTTAVPMAEVTSDTKKIKVKKNKKTSQYMVTVKGNGSVTFKAENEKVYTVKFKVETPKAVKEAKKLPMGGESVTRDVTQLFGTTIKAGRLEIMNEKTPGQASVSGNVLTIEPKQPDSIKLQYSYLNKKYRIGIKVK